MAEMSRENAREVDGYWGTIDKAVEYLIDCRNKGESICINFNGKTLYSVDVTLESAYLQITGLTREESNNARDELIAAETEEQEQAIVEKYNILKQGHIDEQKKTAKQVDGYWGTIDKAVEYLIECRNKGESICIDFNGKILYSADVTLESAYLQITGLTREESNNARDELVAAETEEQEQAIVEKYNALKQRHIDEQNIKQKQKEKAQLTFEISDIERQLKDLKAKEAELKKKLGEKQFQLNGLEEK